MDSSTLVYWRETIKRILNELAAITYPNVLDVRSKTVFDESSDNYLVLNEGWKGVKRLHGIVVHIEIIDEKIWIQIDGTEYGIAGELLEAGIPKDKIVLGFKPIDSRKYTEFAVG